ncbi:MAG TPA: DUF502 domain-containing protein [Thermodesulfobacteriota bacterium]|nr:DUF502 domain-containing protein [Thermodesulfobacteriota bacterium]HOC38342.1 DUF502 domain-containing protein [Thermodesulfobacteriota bacterium]
MHLGSFSTSGWDKRNTKEFLRHAKTYIFRGFLAITPLALSVIAIGFIYSAIDRQITKVVEKALGFGFPGLGILLMLVLLYLIGLVTSNVLGKQILAWLERISNRIPLIKTTYKIGQQLSASFSLPERQIFKRAVLVDYLKPGIWTIGFVTGTVIDRQNGNETLLKVFVPTPPNPTSGTMIVVRESDTRDPGWTIEESLKAVVSGGIIGPTEIRAWDKVSNAE